MSGGVGCLVTDEVLPLVLHSPRFEASLPCQRGVRREDQETEDSRSRRQARASTEHPRLIAWSGS